MPSTKEKNQELSFEAALARLDEITALLERDSVPLDELMKHYEEGVGLLAQCHAQLDKAEQKVKLLCPAPDGSGMYLEDFDQATATEDGPAKTRRTAKASSAEDPI